MRRTALAALSLLTAAVLVPSSSQAAPSPAPAPAASAAPRAATTGTAKITGRVTDQATGEPIAGACVTVHYYNQYQVYGHACTGADGRYTIGNARGNNFYLKLTTGEQELWWPGRLDRTYASAVEVWGTDVVADFGIERRTGTVRGSLTRQDASPAVHATARFFPVGSDQAVAFAAVGADGSFTRSGLPVGAYHVSFVGSGYGEQWYPAKGDRADATPVTVTENGTVDLVEQFRAVDPMPAPVAVSTLSGLVKAGGTGGTPVAGARVDLLGLGLVTLGTALTDAEGRFAIPGMRLGIPAWTRVSAPGYATTWNVDDPEPASPRTLTASGMFVALGVKPGRLSIRVVDHDGSLPYPGTTAYLTNLAGTWTYTMPVRFDGTIELAEVPAGEYRLKLTAPDGMRPAQWYPGKLTSAEAQTITITGGEATTLTETLIGPARAEVTLLDAVTGAPISGACVVMSTTRVCTDEGGVYQVQAPDMGLATRVVYAFHEPYHYSAQQSFGLTGPGGVIKVTLRMKPGAVISAKYRDGVNGQLTDPVCVHAVRGTWGDTIVDNPGTGVCAQPDTDGRLLLGPFQPGTVQLFVAPRDLAGAQWLGRSGGTGDRRTAAPLELKAGQVTAAPEIIAAPARSISGTIRRAENGDLLTDACASVAPVLYSCAGGGSYRLDGLGPYPWQVKYAEVDSAAIRTGESGAPATTDLSSGSVTDANARLGFGTWVPVALTGMQVEYAQFTAYDAYTGMVVGGGPSGYGVRVPPNRAVVLKVVYDNNTCWGYFGLGSRTTPYLAVGTTEPKQVNLTPGKNCLTREPFRSPVRMRPLPGPVVVKTFSPGPWLRGTAGAGVVANGSAVTSPWGVPTDARLARVKN